ncbi:MAG: Trm112 family protein [Anaerolineae bacterium]
MKRFVKLATVLAVVAAAVFVIKKLLEDRDTALPMPVRDDFGAGDLQSFDESELGGEVSQELLDILVCPEDKGPLNLSDDGKWLINPRNGYRYPIRKGIPVMLIEEGRKYRDESLIEEPAEPPSA